MLRIIQNYKILPMLLAKVPAGFPSPADDHLDKDIDIVEYLVRRPSSTFVLQVQGDSMIDAGIKCGDHVIVDKSIHPKSGSIVIAILNGEMTLKYYERLGEDYYLSPANKRYNKIKLDEHNPPETWGVVVGTFRKY